MAPAGAWQRTRSARGCQRFMEEGTYRKTCAASPTCFAVDGVARPMGVPVSPPLCRAIPRLRCSSCWTPRRTAPSSTITWICRWIAAVAWPYPPSIGRGWLGQPTQLARRCPATPTASHARPVGNLCWADVVGRLFTCVSLWLVVHTSSPSMGYLMASGVQQLWREFVDLSNDLLTRGCVFLAAY